jgi:hypothetical protein
LVAGLLLSGVAIAGESVPIEDRDAFEQQYIECIMSGAKDNCMVLIFSSLPVPRNKDKGEIVEMLNKYYLKEIAHQPVYKVHVIERVMKAGVFDNRSYLIERDDGSLVGLYVSFRNIKDKWFVFKFTLNLSYGYIFKLLDMPFEYSENKK